MIQDQQVPRNALAWIILSLFTLVAPHAARLPVWVLAVYAIAAGWRIMVYRGRWSFPGRRVKLALILTAFLGILPYALIAEIAEEDGNRNKKKKEAMFFAVRNFSTKLGQTVGIMAFTILTLLGKDPFDDLGIRLSAVFGGILCILAGLIFTRFEEPEGA